MNITRLSTRGGAILRDGILLPPAAHFPDTDLDEVAGCLRSTRKPKMRPQARAAVRREVMRRHDSGRY